MILMVLCICVATIIKKEMLVISYSKLSVLSYPCCLLCP